MTTEIHDTHTCPCEMCDWARETAASKPKSPSETYYGHPRLDTGADLAVGGAGNPAPDPQHPFQPSEGLNRQEMQNRAIPVSATEQLTLDSPALRRTRSIDDAIRSDTALKGAFDEQRPKSYDPEPDIYDAVAEFRDKQERESIALRNTRSILHHAEMVEERKHAQLTFEQEWRDAPKWAMRTTEEAAAQYWFIRGQHAKEVELLAGMNGDLREMIRVARERVER